MVRILMVGDIAGKVGMRAVKLALPKLKADRHVDFIVANGENAAGGIGLTPALVKELFQYDIDCITTGNHVWRQGDLVRYIDSEPRVLRPHNMGPGQPGTGVGVYETPAGVKIGVVNLIGRVYMDPADNPFVAFDAALEQLDGVKIRLVDMHAEATSEKRAMGYYCTGKASAVVGTHTHVQTADDQILDESTAYITDLGMTGPHDSIIGMRSELIIKRFVTGMPVSFKPAKGNPRLQAVLLEVDETSGKATSIERIDLPVPVDNR